MKTNMITVVALIIVAAGIFSGYEKNADKPCTSTNRIDAVNYSGYEYHIWYNADSSVNKITHDNRVDTYVYAGDSTVITETDTAGAFRYKEIIKKNSYGLATNLRHYSDAAGTSWFNNAYEYNNGVELSKQTYTTNSGGTPSTVTFSWANQNLVSYTTNNFGTYSLEYYPDKLRQAGDYFDLAYRIVKGYEIYRTKNLIKTYNGINYQWAMTYNFKPDGKISGYILNGTNSGNHYTDTVSYQYECR
jgi:hypothetical protein